MQITDSDREYWAFVPLKMTSVPKVKNSQWVSNEIDHFVLSKLEAAGLQPNNPAQHRALLRRLYFDIIACRQHRRRSQIFWPQLMEILVQHSRVWWISC